MKQQKFIKLKIEKFNEQGHEIWLNLNTNLRTTIPHHREIKEGTLRNILKQAQVNIEDFLMS